MSKRLVLITLAVIGIIFIPQVFAGSNNRAYQYPYATDSEEWKALTRPERVAVSQIPEDILQDMSTKSLIDAVLAYPMRADLFVINTYRQGFLKVYSEFNGLQELVGREEAALGLLQKYKAMKIGDPETVLDLKFIEILLAQREITEKTEQAIRDEIEKEVDKKLLEKERYSDIYGISKYTYCQAVDEQDFDSGD